MIDFIKELNSDNEINSKEIYEHFKTDSFDLNSKFLSNIQKHKTVKDFFNYYSKIDFIDILKLFDCLDSLSQILSDNNKIFNTKIDLYLSEVSKIIIFLLLIEKTKEVLNKFIENAKNNINNFITKKENIPISNNINNCLLNLINTSPLQIQRSLSRRATKEKTLTSNNNQNCKRNSLLTNMTSDDSELIVLDNNTPKFKEKEISNKSSVIDKKDSSIIKSSEKSMDSLLSLKNMKFMFETEEKNQRGIKKKNKTIKFGFEKQEAELFLKQKSNSNTIKENSKNIDDLNKSFEYNPKNVDKSQILADILNTINCQFENGKINSEQKLSLKQLLISDSENVINRFYKFNESAIHFNTDLKSIFKKFLISELDNIL